MYVYFGSVRLCKFIVSDYVEPFKSSNHIITLTVKCQIIILALVPIYCRLCETMKLSFT
jgi:competence transcription factor ComK